MLFRSTFENVLLQLWVERVTRMFLLLSMWNKVRHCSFIFLITVVFRKCNGKGGRRGLLTLTAGSVTTLFFAFLRSIMTCRSRCQRLKGGYTIQSQKKETDVDLSDVERLIRNELVYSKGRGGIPARSDLLLLESQSENGSDKLKRRKYNSPGPNYCWHVDGNDEQKPFRFSLPNSWCWYT